MSPSEASVSDFDPLRVNRDFSQHRGPRADSPGGGFRPPELTFPIQAEGGPHGNIIT
jgi:hypothetical protein